MYRKLMDDLVAWQEDKNRRILLLKGAVGVGKTWCVLDFAEAFFPKKIHIELREDAVLRELFMTPHDTGFIDAQLELLYNISLQGDHREDLLLVFDNVEVEEDLFAGVMQYARQKSNLSIIVIASWWGMLGAEGILSEELMIKYMYPMSFEEYLIANKAQDVCRMIANEREEGIPTAAMPVISNYLREFYITGGMPEVVADFIRNHSYENVDLIQKNILQNMRDRLVQFAPKLYLNKILQVWDSVPAQLTKENKKFMYGFIDKKARAREYVGAVNYLVNAGYVRKVRKIKDGISPIEDQIERRSFELYHLDHGLIRAMDGITAVESHNKTDLFNEMNGIISEQVVLEEFTLNPNVPELYFWTSEATAKVDFIFEDDGQIIPVDVQSIIRTKAQNLKVYHQRYHNELAIRISMERLNYENDLLNIPIYGLWNF